MADNFQLLSTLVYGTNWNSIRVRVARLWFLVSQKTKEPYSLNLQLLDSEGNQKLAVVSKRNLQRFENTFEEQSIYEITRFNVQDSDKDFKAIDEELTITLRVDTQVRKLHEDINSIPRYKFGFVHDDVLPSRINKKGQLTDVGGILFAITPVLLCTRQDGTQSVRRQLHLEFTNGKTSVVSLWYDKKDLVDDSLLESYSHPIPTVVTSTSISIYGQSIVYDSTKATKVYTNINVSPIDDFFKSTQHANNRKLLLLNSTATSAETTNIETVHCSLAHLQEEVRAANCRGKNYVVQATITKLRTSSSWFYNSCLLCKRTVHLDGTAYKCDKCKTIEDNPLKSTTSTAVTAFDKEAEKLIGVNVNDMINISKMDNCEMKVENIFQKLVGIDAVFEFQPNNYEMNTKDAILTARRVTKKNITSPLSSPTSQTKTDTEYSATTDIAPTNSANNSSTKLDYKGKKLAVDNDIIEPINAHQHATQTRKETKRGIHIVDDDEVVNRAALTRTQPGDKRRKK